MSRRDDVVGTPLPHPAGPWPLDACQPPLPLPGLRGYNGAGSSTASSTVLQVGRHSQVGDKAIEDISLHFHTPTAPLFWMVSLREVYTSVRCQHTKGVQIPAFSVASERRAVAQPHVTFDGAASDLSLAQTRIRIWSWNLGPKRGSPGVIENHIAGRWHIVAVQDSMDFLPHEDIIHPFLVTIFRGCSALFYKHTFEQSIEVKAMHRQGTLFWLGIRGRQFQSSIPANSPETADRTSRGCPCVSQLQWQRSVASH